MLPVQDSERTEAALQVAITEARIELRRIKSQFCLYEQAMRSSREQDENRRKELDARETALRARERVLQREEEDFEARKKRFQELQELN